MSSDAIIAGLKQGNAIEMASLEEVKEGMSSVIDGLLKECYNRSDALSDLMEKVQLVSIALLWSFTDIWLTLTHRKARERRPKL